MSRSPSRRPRSDARSDDGVALIVALSSFALAAVFAFLMYSAAQVETRGVKLDVDRTQAFEFAEGVVEVAEHEILDAVANFHPFPPPPAGRPFEVMQGTEAVHGVSATWTISRVTSMDAAGNPAPVPPVTAVDPSTGLKLIVEPFDIEARATFGTGQVTVRKRIELQKIPIFQFLAFYEGDLEINPGPDMLLNGRVHANGDIYVSADAGLTVDTTYFRTAGDFHRHRKDSGSVGPGAVRILDSTDQTLEVLPSQGDLAGQGITSPWGLDSDFTGWDLDGDGRFDLPGEMAPFKDAVTELFGETLQTGEHGVSPVAHPNIQSIQPFEPVPGGTGGDYVDSGNGTFVAVPPGTGTHSRGFYHEQAELVIVDDRVYDGYGNDITTLLPSGFLVEKTLYDAREGRDVAVTEVDLARLGDLDGDPATLDPSPYYPDNGLVYAYRTDTAPGQATGVVLTGGSELNVPEVWNSDNYGGTNPHLPGAPPPGAYPFGAAESIGITVVAPTSVYVHGDFNTTSKKASAVIADTVHLLSNAWDYSKAPGALPAAQDTTFNFAMITGNQATSPGAYNGGFENLPRFHERWSGKTCTISGSFVNTWRSAVATGSWFYGGDSYTAPNRAWSYDQGFDTQVPPFTPMVIDIRSLGWQVSG